MLLVPGTRLGPYEILGPIGAGGMGEVYRARDAKLNRDVALKILSPAFATDHDRLTRFRREAQVLAALNHPNIGHIYGFEDTGATHALVMELVDGPTLAERLAHGPLPLADALPIAKQIAAALEAAHEQGIVHRDLKPANIKVRPDGTVKVLDFGLAKPLGPAAASETAAARADARTTTTSAITERGVILGTAAYMSPEQAAGKAVDKRSDLWGFGAVLLEMLTGRRAFDGPDVVHVLAAVLNGEPDWTRLPAETPPAVRRLLRRCLEKDRRRRMADASDARLELDEAGSPADHEGRLAPAPGLAPRTRLTRVVWIGAALVLAALTGVAAWRLKPAPSVPHVVSRLEYRLPEGQKFTRVGRHVLAISPDGTKIAYVANRQLYLRVMDQLDAQPIRGTDEDPSEPVFSPDGQWIAYFVPCAGCVGGTLRKIAVAGGAPVTLCRTEGDPYGMSWRNGTIAFGQYQPGAIDAIQWVPETGGTAQTLITVDPKDGHPTQPQLLADGQHVLFTLVRSGGGAGADVQDNTILAVPFDARRLTVTGGPVPIVEGVVSRTIGVGQFAVSRDGTLAYQPGTSTSIAVPRVLVWVDRQGREQSIAAKPRAYEYARLSPDGTKIAVNSQDDQSDIWIWDLAKETLTRLTFGPQVKVYPTWMPDSRRVLFVVLDKTTRGDIFRKAADGTGPLEALTKDGTGGEPQSISRDGKLLVFRTEPSFLRLLSLDGTGRSTPLLGDSKVNAVTGAVSPDGRWIAYDSAESGRSEVYVRPFPAVDGGRWQISSEGGRWPAWSRSGGELFFAAGGRLGQGQPSARLMAVAIQAGAAFSYARPQSLFDTSPYLRGDWQGRDYDVAADGRFLMAKAAEADPQVIVVVTHWFDELGARVKNNKK